MCRGDTDAVWNEAEGEAFRGAMGETKVVLPRVGECEEGSGVVRWEWYGKVSRRIISERMGIVEGANWSWRCCCRISQRGRIKSMLVYR